MAARTSRQAEEDIARAFEYGALEFGFRRASDYLFGLREVIEMLGNNPYLVRERVEYQPPVRIYPYRAHSIVYRIENEDAEILRVLGARQDWKRHL